jgi:hypothetical protein
VWVEQNLSGVEGYVSHGRGARRRVKRRTNEAITKPSATLKRLWIREHGYTLKMDQNQHTRGWVRGFVHEYHGESAEETVQQSIKK